MIEPLPKCPQFVPGATWYATEALHEKEWNLWQAAARLVEGVWRYFPTGCLILGVPEKKLAQIGTPVQLCLPA